MANYRKWLKCTLAGSLSVLIMACGTNPPVAPTTPDTPAITPIDPLPVDSPAADEPTDGTTPDDGTTTDTPTDQPSADASPSDVDATPTPEPTASADASPTPEPTPTPTATPTPTPVATATANPLGNDNIDAYGDGKLTGPTGITIDKGTVYVADNYTSSIMPNGSKVKVFDNSGNWKQDISKSSLSPLQYNATGVAIAKFKIFVSTANSFGGLEFKNTNGTFSQFGIGDHDSVAGVAADDAGNLYVANTSDGCVSKFSDTGDTQQYYFVNGVNPVGLSFDSAQNLYVADYISKKIKVVSPAGAAVREFATGINSLGAIAVDKRTGEVYAVDIGTHQVKRFSAEGTEVQVFGGTVLSEPRGIAIDDAGTIHVVDRGTLKVFRFTAGR